MLGPALSRLAHLGAFVGLLVFVADAVDARGGRGGGARGGGGASMSRGGGYSRGGNMSRGGSYSRPSGGASRGGAGSRQTAGQRGGAGSRQTAGQRQGAGQRADARGANRGDRQASRGDRQTGRQDNRGNRQDGRGDRQQGRQDNRGDRQANRGDRNTNINTGDNININNDFEGDWDGWGGYTDYPIGAGLAIGAVAGLTAAAYGSAYYALPGGCAPYPYGGYSYYSCGGAYYQPQYEGDTVVYVTVPEPGGSDVTVIQE